MQGNQFHCVATQPPMKQCIRDISACQAHPFGRLQCCQVKNLQMAKMGSKYGQKWPDLGFANGQLNGQLFVLYSALKRSNLEQKIAWGMCKDIRKINIPTKP